MLSNYAYKPGTVANALKGWDEVVGYVSKEEYWTRGFTVGEEKGKDGVRTVETYEGWGFWEKVHLESELVGRKQQRDGRDRVGEGVVKVVAVDGFLGREGKARL